MPESLLPDSLLFLLFCKINLLARLQLPLAGNLCSIRATMKIKINPGAHRMLCLVSAMTLGGSVPVIWRSSGVFFDNYAGNFVPVMIMTMLLFSFIDAKFGKGSTGWSHLRILLFMTGLASAAYFATEKLTGNTNFAVMAFLIGMSPTANAAPVITHLLKRREDYVTVSVVLTNLFTAFALAPLVALVIGNSIQINTFALAWKTILLIGTPFLLAVILCNFAKPAAEFVRRKKFLSFYLWMVMLFTVCAQSATYICKQENLSPVILLEIFAISATLCAINFIGGFFLGEKHFRRECSQSVGQKNTMLMLWVGLAFFNPIVALGPTFYVVCHNLWNSWQLRRADKNASTIR